MKRFIKNILLFLIVPLICLISLFGSSYEKSFAWHFIEGDCGGHGAWMYSRIYQNPKPIDVAFIGSSHIISAMNDEQIEHSFQKAGKELHLANLGYCRLGRNMSYLLTKALIEQKQPEYLILEVRFDEDHYSHPVFPYLADTEDVLNPVFFFNRDVFSDVYLACVARIEFWKQQLFYPDAEHSADMHPFGHASSAGVADPDILEEKKAGRIKKANQKIPEMSRNFYMAFPRAYLEKISKLCREHSVQLIFLYTPSFGYIDYPPRESETYQRLGSLWMPPASLLNDKTRWADDVHLNEAGGKACSEWFVGKFRKEIIN